MPEDLTEDRASEIRDQERRKLQGVIDKLSKEKEELNTALKSFEAKNTQESNSTPDANKITKTLERLEKMLEKEDNKNMPELAEIRDMLANMSAPKDPKELETMKQQISELSKAIQDERERNQQMATELTSKQRKLMVSEAIRSFGKPVIEELVGGDTEEEIMASVEKAAQRYEDIVKSVTKDKPSTSKKEVKDDTPAEEDTEPDTQPVAGEEDAPESVQPKSQSPQPHATGSGPTPSLGASQSELIEKLNTLSPKERITFLNENRDVLERIAARQFQG